MKEDYISYIRSKVGHGKIILNFAGGIMTDNQNRVLLQLRADKETWAIPGGTVELGESTLDTCLREFYEETGIEVSAKRFLNLYSNFDESYPNGDQVQTIVAIYEVEAINEFTIVNFHNEETKRLQFFSEKEIQALGSVSKKHRLMLNEFFTNSFAIGH